MSDKDTLNVEKLQTNKDNRQQKIKALMDSKAKNLEDKIASLRMAHQLDKGRIQSALSEMMGSSANFSGHADRSRIEALIKAGEEAREAENKPSASRQFERP